MSKNKAMSSVENTIKKLHIQKNMHLIYKQDLYKDKQKETDDLFIEYLVPIMEDIDHPALIGEWGKKSMLLLMKKIDQDVKISSIKKKIDCNDKTEYWPTSIKENINWLPFFNIMDFLST